jgi:hypothetical protein
MIYYAQPRALKCYVEHNAEVGKEDEEKHVRSSKDVFLRTMCGKEIRLIHELQKSDKVVRT